MARDSFIFYRSFYDAIKEIPETEQLQVYKAISIYALEQEEIELSGVAKAIFLLVKPQLDANYKKYENGKQKGSKAQANNKQKESKSVTNVNVNDNDNVNVNVNANDKVSDSCVDGLPEIIKFYEDNIGPITPYSVEILQSYAEEMQSDLLIFAMQKATEANIRTIKYIKGILNNWSKKGIKTIVEARKEDENFRNKEKQVKKIEKDERQYTADELNALYANVIYKGE